MTVRACPSCQSSPDREFRDVLANQLNYVLPEPTRQAIDFIKYSRERETENPRSQEFSNLLSNITRKSEAMLVDHSSSTSIEARRDVFEWPKGLRDTIALKLVHGYYWLFTKGKILSDTEGKIIIKPYQGTSGDNWFLQKTHMGVNMGDGRFMSKVMYGNDDHFDHVGFLSFHFYAKDGTPTGYNLLTFIMPDEVTSLPDVNGLFGQFMALASQDLSSTIYSTKDKPSDIILYQGNYS